MCPRAATLDTTPATPTPSPRFLALQTATVSVPREYRTSYHLDVILIVIQETQTWLLCSSAALEAPAPAPALASAPAPAVAPVPVCPDEAARVQDPV